METQKILKPSVSINLRKPVVRINKDTISAIGNSEYIILLVNPEDCTLGVSPGNKNDKRAHCISKYNNYRNTMELYSKSFVSNLLKLCPDWHKQGTYRIEGKEIKGMNIVKFVMSNATEIKRTIL